MKLIRLPIWACLLGLALAACSASPSALDNVPKLNTSTLQPPSASAPTPAPSDDQGAMAGLATPTDPSTQPSPTPEAVAAQDLARTDSQGAVTMAITPLNLSAPGETLDFEVAMDTHSVDLSMDLATLAVLSADNGRMVQATAWEAPQGGHHVSGKLSFPASAGGVAVLEGAAQVTLTVRGVDVPERVFVWELIGH